VDLDQRAEELLSELQSVNERRNELTAVAVLPPELLARIFEYCRDTSLNEPPIRWAVVSHVCRRWRFVALAHPVLWTVIDFFYEGWAEAMLSRSEGLFISVTTGVRRWSMPDMQGYFQQNLTGPETNELARCQNLAVRGPDAQDIVEPEWTEFLSAPAPFLESFELDMSNLRGWSRANDLPSPLFGGDLPALARLILKNCWFNGFNGPLLHNLTHLDLQYKQLELPASTLDVFAILRSAPRLQSVILLNCINDASGLPVTKVDLPELRHFRIEDCASACALYLDCLTADPVKLYISCWYQFDNRLSPLLQCISNYRLGATRDGRSMNYLCLSLTNSDTRTITIHAAPIVDAEDNPSLDFSWKMDEWTLYTEDIDYQRDYSDCDVMNIAEGLGLDECTVIEVSSCELVERIARHLQSCEELRLRPDAMDRHSLTALHGFLTDEVKLAWLPALRMLTIYDMDFGVNGEGLVQWLVTRRASDLGPFIVNFEGCSRMPQATASDLESLKLEIHFEGQQR
jgi:hypothetical protein